MTVLDSSGYRHGFVTCGPNTNRYSNLLVVAELNGGKWTYRTIEKGKSGKATVDRLNAHAGHAQAVIEHNTIKRYDVPVRQ